MEEPLEGHLRVRCPSKEVPSQKSTDSVANLTDSLGPENGVQSCIY